MQLQTTFTYPPFIDLNRAQTAFNLAYRVSAVIDTKQDGFSYCLKHAIAGKMPLAKILTEVAEQAADERSYNGVVSVLGIELTNDILKWYEL